MRVHTYDSNIAHQLIVQYAQQSIYGEYLNKYELVEVYDRYINFTITKKIGHLPFLIYRQYIFLLLPNYKLKSDPFILPHTDIEQYSHKSIYAITMTETHDDDDRISGMMTGRDVFISGGTGFMGKVLVEKLLR